MWDLMAETWLKIHHWLETGNQLIANLGNLGQALTAVIAGVALGFAWAQIRSSNSGQMDATLQELNRDQNRASLDHPRFANPSLGKIDYEANPPTFDESPDKYESYYWFVVLGLVMHEQAHRTKMSAEWKPITTDFFNRHKAILSSPRFKSDWWMYDRQLQKSWHHYVAERPKG